jgi:hypothetical protein
MESNTWCPGLTVLPLPHTVFRLAGLAHDLIGPVLQMLPKVLREKEVLMFEVDPVSWTPICLSFGVHDVEEAPPYAPEFRRQMIELIRAGRTPEQLTQHGPTRQRLQGKSR